jgi:hypothetical protein
MRKALMIGLCSLFMVGTMAGCVSRNETEIAKAQARADTARYDYLAAEAKASGAVGVAQAQSQTAIVREQEKTERETAWLQVLPILALIVAGAGAVYLVLYYRGKAHIIQVQAQANTMLLPPPSRPALPEPVRRACLEYDATATPDPSHPGAWIVVAANGYKVRMLPPPR